MCLRNSNDEPVKGEIDCELHDLVLRPIQKPLQNLICVSSHRLLVVDIVMLKTLIKKCFKRFRTSKISRISSLVSIVTRVELNNLLPEFFFYIRMQQINSYVNKYTKLELNVHLKQKLDTFTKTNDNYCIVSFEEIFEVMQKMIDAVQILKVIVQYVNKSSTELLYWLKLGHFPRQIKILTATLARIR